MKTLLRLSAAIDQFTAFIGHAVSWLILIAVLISAGNAVIRKAFDMSSNAWLELQWYLFSAVFLLAASYTLQRNDHIRIDIISAMLPKSVRNLIDLLGHVLMLMPFVILMIYESLPLRHDLFCATRGVNECRRADRLAGESAAAGRLPAPCHAGRLGDH